MKFSFLYAILLAIAIVRAQEGNSILNVPSTITTKPKTNFDAIESVINFDDEESTTKPNPIENTTVFTPTETTTKSNVTKPTTVSTPTETTTVSTPTETTTKSNVTKPTTVSTPTETTTVSTPTETTTKSNVTKPTTVSTPTETTTVSTPTETTTKSNVTKPTTVSTPTETTTVSTPTETTTKSNVTEPTTVSTPTEPTTKPNVTEPTTEPTTIANPEEYPNQVTEGNKTCILSKMTIELTVSYNTTDNQTKDAAIKVPADATTEGKCGDTESHMNLTWFYVEESESYKIVNDFETDEKNIISFHFKKDDSKFSMDEINVQIYLDEKHFPNAKEGQLLMQKISDLSWFSASATNGKYVCTDQTFDAESENMKLSISDVSLIAFNENNDISSRSEENCSNDTVATANVGAIVGGVIGALAVVGIIGFIIWRRRRNSTVRSEVP